METISEIKKLPESVINRIAAGEVVQRPANVIKELLENSLDAGATQIVVTVKCGGLSLLQIQDNGHGVKYNDLEILCHRFTTSKLRLFEDLQTISTFGFRGEALASISHVAHLTVVTKTSDSQLAYKTEYVDGIMRENPKPCAGNQGTIITVEDLFYNMPIRRKALKSANEEHTKIVDVVAKYALHNPKVGFLLKRHNESSVDVRTLPNSTREQIVSSLFGAVLSKDLISFKTEQNVYSFSAEGYVSHPSYSGKKFLFVLFINDRLVDCNALKRGLELLFSQTLPKNHHPFVYLSLKIAPQNLDVNVHPTKQEVHFLHENEIIEELQNVIERKILYCNESRTFYVKNLQQSTLDDKTSTSANEKCSDVKISSAATTSVRVYDHQLVRTDCKERKLEEFFSQKVLRDEEIVRINFANTQEEETVSNQRILSPTVDLVDDQDDLGSQSSNHSEETRKDEVSLMYAEDSKNQHWRKITLTSVLSLQQEIRDVHSPYMRSLIRDHTFVGSIDAKLSLIQHKTSLYLIDTNRLSEELFYQLMIFRFANFGVYRLKEPCSLYDLTMVALEQKESSWNCHKDKPKSELAGDVVDLLTSKSALLLDYFSLEIKDGCLLSLPSILDEYVPQFEGLPLYILRLASEVNWQSEIACFRSVCRETAKFYALKSQYCKGVDYSAAGGPNYKWKWLVESFLYPTFKAKLLPPACFASNGCFTKLTDLNDLYKVFERIC